MFSEGDKDGHSFAGAAGKLQSPFQNLSRSLEGLGDEDTKDSFECLYIDETTEGKEKGNRGGSSSKWDTDSSMMSSESQNSKAHRHRHKKNDKDRKHKHHKSKHKNKSSEKEDSKHKQKHGDKRFSNKSDSKQGKSKNLSLNDALAGALDGMEELIKSSNYAERVAQSQ